MDACVFRGGGIGPLPSLLLAASLLPSLLPARPPSAEPHPPPRRPILRTPCTPTPHLHRLCDRHRLLKHLVAARAGELNDGGARHAGEDGAWGAGGRGAGGSRVCAGGGRGRVGCGFGRTGHPPASEGVHSVRPSPSPHQPQPNPHPPASVGVRMMRPRPSPALTPKAHPPTPQPRPTRQRGRAYGAPLDREYVAAGHLFQVGVGLGVQVDHV